MTIPWSRNSQSISKKKKKKGDPQCIAMTIPWSRFSQMMGTEHPIMVTLEKKNYELLTT